MENKVKVVDKSTMINVVQCLANIYGFGIREDMKFSWIPYLESKDVAFTFHERFDFDKYRETGEGLTYITLNVSVNRMGGQPTVEELMETAHTISEAARLMQQFNSRNYAVKTEKEDE